MGLIFKWFIWTTLAVLQVTSEVTFTDAKRQIINAKITTVYLLNLNNNFSIYLGNFSVFLLFLIFAIQSTVLFVGREMSPQCFKNPLHLCVWECPLEFAPRVNLTFQNFRITKYGLSIKLLNVSLAPVMISCVPN